MLSETLDQGLSASEPDLVTADKEKWNSGFPPGVTVDELWVYRKRKPPADSAPHDNLQPSEGSLKDAKSEYTAKYTNYLLSSSCGDLPGVSYASVKATQPSDYLKFEGNQELKPEYNESFIEYPLDSLERRRSRNADIGSMENINLGDGGEGKKFDCISEFHSAYTTYRDVHREHPIRRPGNLTLEGDLSTTTESAAKFIQYLLTGRPELTRKPTALKLEGEMDTKTENRDKFVPLEYQKRPPLCKKSTNLHLEGDLGILSENHAQYIPYEFQERPTLRKRSTNLHLEGDLLFDPEYRDVFVEYKVEKCKPLIPINNLKTEGMFDTQSETTSKFLDHHIHPTIPFLRGYDGRSSHITLGDDSGVSRAEYRDKFIQHPQLERSRFRRPSEHLKQEGQMDVETENMNQFVEKPASRSHISRMPNNLLLEGRIDMNPEYRNAYIDFRGEKHGSPTRRTRKISQESNLKSEGVIEINPEYRSSYINFPRQRPHLYKPAGSLSTEGEMDHITEKSSKYIPHEHFEKSESMKREPELKLEGRFECQPEYRKAYIDYLIREKSERKQRPLDNLSVSATRNVEVTLNQPEDSKESKTSDSDVDKGAPSYASETESSRKKATKPPTPKTLSRIESSAFGPKLTVPSQASRSGKKTSNQTSRSSRSSSPRVDKSRRASDITPRPKVLSRFGSPVRVENLALKEAPKHALPVNVSARSRWQKRDSPDKAFVVLDNTQNNNTWGRKYDMNRNYPELYKEQKWMPSWYNSSM